MASDDCGLTNDNLKDEASKHTMFDYDKMSKINSNNKNNIDTFHLQANSEMCIWNNSNYKEEPMYSIHD